MILNFRFRFASALLLSHALCLMLVIAAYGCGVPMRQPPPVASSGVVVEAVAPGSAAEKAVLRPGDNLLQVADRPLHSPFALQAAEESGAGVPIVVRGRRGSAALEVSLPAGDTGLKVRPVLSPRPLELYEAGESQVQAGHWEAAIGPWSAAANAAETAGDRAGAGWLCSRLGELYRQREQWKLAWQWQRHGWDLVKSGDDTAAQASVLQSLGFVEVQLRYYNLMKLPPTSDWYARARQVDTKAGYRVWYAECLSEEARASLDDDFCLPHPRAIQARAEERLKQAGAILQELAPESRAMADCLVSRGVLAYDQSDAARAREYYQQALDIYQKTAPDSPQMAYCFLKMAYCLSNSQLGISTRTLAQDYDRHALAIFAKLVPDSLSVAGALANLGVYADEPAKKLEYSLRALAIYQKQAPEALGLALILDNVRSYENDPARAKRDAQRALALAQRFPVSRPLAQILHNMGNDAALQSRWADADWYLHRALAVYQKVATGSSDLPQCYRALGGVAIYRGHLEQAEKYFEAELNIVQKSGSDTKYVAGCLNNLGVITLDQGQLTLSRNYFQRALALRQKLDPGSLDVASQWTKMGIVASAHGDYARAKDYYQRALSLCRNKAPDSQAVEQEAENLNNLGTVAQYQGDLSQAEQYLRDALAIYASRKPGSPTPATILSNLGTLQIDRDVREARKNLEKALDLFRKLYGNSPVDPDASAMADCLDSLGLLARKTHNLPKAQQYYSEALQLCQRVAPNSESIVDCLINLGGIAQERGQLPVAQRYFTQAGGICQQQAPDSLEAVECLIGQGGVLFRQGQPGRALPAFTQAVNILEDQRNTIPDPESRALFLEQHADPYFDLLRVQLTLHQERQAYETLERNRARSLIEARTELDHPDLTKGVPSDLLKKRQALADARLVLARKRLRLASELSPTKAHDLDAQATKLAVQQRQLEATIRHAAPHFADLVYPKSLTCEEAQKALDDGTLLLAYALGDEQSYLFALTNRQLKVYSLALDTKQLAEEVQQFNTGLIKRGNYQALARRLYRQLLAPARFQIMSARRLLLCPDGPLHALAFSALVTSPEKRPVQHLIEAKPLHVIVSMKLYRDLRHTPVSSSGKILALADPDYTETAAAVPGMTVPTLARDSGQTEPARQLAGRGLHLAPIPETKEQVVTLQRLFGDRVKAFTEREATVAVVRREAPDATLIHLACHGLLDTIDPLASSLALSRNGADEGLLSAYDILGMHLKADLVMLSACETGQGTQTRFEGVTGMTRALQYAGARSVGVTLWSVDATSATALMSRFYERLHGGANKDEALQQAQIAVMRDRSHPDWSHPYYWAAFQMVGDYRQGLPQREH